MAQGGISNLWTMATACCQALAFVGFSNHKNVFPPCRAASKWEGACDPAEHNLYRCASAGPIMDTVEETASELVEWQPAYMDGPWPLEIRPPDPGDTTVLRRKGSAQEHLRPRPTVKPIRTFHEKLTMRAKRAAKDKLRLQRKLRALEGQSCSSSETSSSFTASSECS